MRPVHFLAVNYHGAGQIATFVSSLRQQTSDEWSLTIVDNSEDPAEADRLRAVTDDKRVDVVATPANLGYFGAARWWYDRAAGPIFDWLVVCNTDLDLARDFVERLVNADRGQHVCAPAVTHYPGGHQQNPFMVNRPSVRSMLVRALGFRWRTTARLYAWASAAATRGHGTVPPARAIYAAHGSIIPIHRRFFAAGGTLDHQPFLFGEEITLAEQVRQRGGSVWFEPSLQVVHRANQATGTKRNRRIWRMQREATRNSYRLVRAG